MGTMEVVVTIFICFNACECLRLPISNNLLPNLPWPINETFRFTDDPSPAKKSNPARAASSPKPAPKPSRQMSYRSYIAAGRPASTLDSPHSTLRASRSTPR